MRHWVMANSLHGQRSIYEFMILALVAHLVLVDASML